MSLLNCVPVFRLFLFTVTFFSVWSTVQARDLDANRWPEALNIPGLDPAVESRITAQIDKMSLEQKVGQMIQAEIRQVTPEEVKTYHLGSVLNGGGSFPYNKKFAKASDWVALADQYYQASSQSALGIPILWGTDAVHGHNNVIGATIFPHNIGLGATRDESLIYRIAKATAHEVAVTGLDWTFAPTLAVNRDIRWGRTYESYSSDPEWVTRYGKQMIKGLQGESFGPMSILATAKHYVGDGGTLYGDDQGDVQIDEQTLIDVHAKPYFDAFEAGAQVVMASYSGLNGTKMHAHRYLVQSVLKDRLGFDGFVLSDWNAIWQVPGCDKSHCVETINAGIDMLMIPDRHNWQAAISSIIQSVKNNEISMARIDDAVRRILRVKHRVGLFEAPRPAKRKYAKKSKHLGHKKHRQLAREAVRKSLVLLKNNGQALPIKPKSHVVVLGDLANNLSAQSGGWSISWQGTENQNSDFPGATSIWAGIKKAAESSGGKATLLSEPAALSDEPDAVVVVVGESPYAEFKGDIQNFDTLALSEASPHALRWIRAYQDRGIPVVTVLVTGRPRWSTAEINASDAFVVAWLPGTEGAGVADLLFAKPGSAMDFTGRLSFSWPSTPCDLFGDTTQALFPLGYGLSLAQTVETPDFPVTHKPVKTGCAQLTQNDIQVAKKDRSLELAALYEAPTGRLYPAESAPSKSVSVNSNNQGLSISWRDDVEEKFFVGDPNAINGLAHLYHDHDMLLSFSEVSNPNVPVYVGIECQSPCNAEFRVDPLLKQIHEGKAKTLAISLACFDRYKIDFSKLSAPLTLRAAGPLTVSLSSLTFGKAPKSNVTRYVCD